MKAELVFLSLMRDRRSAGLGTSHPANPADASFAFFFWIALWFYLTRAPNSASSRSSASAGRHWFVDSGSTCERGIGAADPCQATHPYFTPLILSPKSWLAGTDESFCQLSNIVCSHCVVCLPAAKQERLYRRSSPCFQHFRSPIKQPTSQPLIAAIVTSSNLWT